MGVPMVGCQCPVCQSDDPRDKRTRTSVIIRAGDVHILIDTSADYRQQMLRAGIRRLDGVIYTHYHVDHILGMDDLRSLNIINKKSIPIFASQDTLQIIKRVFAYAFSDQAYVSEVPRILPNVIDSDPFEIKGIKVIPVPLLHGKLPVNGYRIGQFAYCTDVSEIPDNSYGLLEDLDILVIGALRYESHPTHFTVAEAVQEAQKISAKQTYFTHLSHRISHADAEKSLPQNVHLAYDGLQITLD